MQDTSPRWVPPWLNRNRARLTDVVLAAGAFVLVLKMDGKAVTGWLVVLAGLASAMTLLRRRYPERVLALATAVTALTIFVGPPAAGLFVTVGALTYSTALYSPRRRPWFYAVTVWTAFMIAGSIAAFSGWWGPSQFGLFAFIFGGAGAGDSVRMRRAYIAEVTERARQAELTREQEAQRRVIDERLRIARELHDVVAHHIAVISVHAGAAGHVLRNRPAEVWPVLGHIRAAADTVLAEIKSVISVLRDPQEAASTEPTPGMERLDDLLETLRITGFRVRHQQSGESRPLPAMVDLAAYRIVQEALTNAHKYGHGSAVLDLEYTADTLTVEVINDIAASRASRSGSGFGLLGMRERATAAHGTINAGAIPGGRFRVHAVLPVDDQAVDRLNAATQPIPVLPAVVPSEGT